MKTVLITGCSSGFGRDTAQYFLERDWQVIATMRKPDESVLPRSDRLRILPLDVTDALSIRELVESAGQIDALVNNAGIGMLASLEGTEMDTVREIFETNTFGTMAVIQAFLPQLRERKAGVIVNVTSSVTLKSLPLLSVYTGSKAAVNAFTESLAIELAQFNIRTHLVLPGMAPHTSFGQNARSRMTGADPEAYAGLFGKVMENFADPGPITLSVDVAEAVWRAVTDSASPMRIPAGADAVALSRTS